MKCVGKKNTRDSIVKCLNSRAFVLFPSFVSIYINIDVCVCLHWNFHCSKIYIVFFSLFFSRLFLRFFLSFFHFIVTINLPLLVCVELATYVYITRVDKNWCILLCTIIVLPFIQSVLPCRRFFLRLLFFLHIFFFLKRQTDCSTMEVNRWHKVRNTKIELEKKDLF